MDVLLGVKRKPFKTFKTMMIEKKIKKYLLNQPEIKFFRKNDSGSEYYKVGESIIRVSNHVAIKNNQPDTLNIVITGENFVVMYGNRLINVNDYNSFKSFLKYHIQMCDCFKDLIHKGLGYKKQEIKVVHKPTTVEVTTPPESSDAQYTRTSNTIRVFGRIFDLSLLSDKQKDGLVSMVEHKAIKDSAAMRRAIDNMLAHPSKK